MNYVYSRSGSTMDNAAALTYCASVGMVNPAIKEVLDLSILSSAFEFMSESLSLFLSLSWISNFDCTYFTSSSSANATGPQAWTAYTPRINPTDIGNCTNDGCDGQFLMDDGVTYYDHGLSGIKLYHDDAMSGCLVVSLRDPEPYLDDLDCSGNRIMLCKNSPPAP